MNFKEEIENYIPCNEQEENDKKIILTRFIKMEDNILTRENEIAHFTASSWIVNKDRTKVLMIYHNIYNSWAWTGGHADGDDNLLHVALKEANEETGLTSLEPIKNDIFSLEIVPVNPHIKRGKFVSGHLHINITYLLEADDKEALKIKEDENSNVGWFTLEEAVKASSEEHMKVIYQKLNNKLKELK